jgi:hypothetical protein
VTPDRAVRELEANVRFWQIAGISRPSSDVRFLGVKQTWPNVRYSPKGRHRRVRVPCPLCANSGHERGLFDQLVGAAEQRHWNSEAEFLGGLKIDDQFEFGRSLDR